MTINAIATIGTLQVHGWEGHLYEIGNEGEDFARLGQVGSGAQITGTRARKSTIRVWSLHASQNAAMNQLQSLYALLWNTTTVVRPNGDVFPRVRIVDVACEPPKAGSGTPVSGSTASTWLVRATLVMEVQP